MRNTFLSWQWKDFFKGLIVATLTPVFPIIQQSLSNGVLTFNWHVIGVTAISGFVAYMIKNFFTDDVKQAEKTLEQASKPK